MTLEAWPQATGDFYYEAHLFLVLDIVIYLGLAWAVDLLVSDPLAFGRGPQTAEADDLEMTDASGGGNDMHGGKGILIKGLSKRFSWSKLSNWKWVEKSVQAVDDLKLEVPPQTIFCLLGSNGAGKSTTGALLTGIIAPDSGDQQAAYQLRLSRDIADRLLVSGCRDRHGGRLRCGP